ncbi:MAG: TlpA disulfide reductase family protein [Microthrixaceae bacterium]
MAHPLLAPELDVTRWFNSPPLDLASLRGKVVLIEAFQMLCPACVSHSIPQAQRVQRMYHSDQVAVLGIHTVFEHHEVMGPDALEAFISEYRITFPVGVDRREGSERIPVTMGRLDLQGTPSQILLDRQGRIRASTFGVVEDLALGTQIGRLLAEPVTPVQAESAPGQRPGKPTAPLVTLDPTADPAGVCEPGQACT